MNATPHLAAAREWWYRVRIGGRRLCAVLPTPLDAIVWQAASILGFTFVVVGGLYLFLWGGLAATSRTAVFVVMILTPLAVAGRIGWRLGTIATTHPDFTVSGPSEQESSTVEEWDHQGGQPAYSSLPARWAWWRLLPPRLQSFVGIIGLGALVSGGAITIGWVVALHIFHLVSLPLWAVALYVLPMVVVVSYGGSLFQTAVGLVSVLWRSSTRRLETPSARRSHLMHGLAVLSGFVIVGVGPVEFLTLPRPLVMAVTWTGLFLYLFVLLTQLQFVGMARPLTPEEAERLIPSAIETDPYTSVFVATAGVRTTAMATGIWPVRRIYVGEALLEDEALVGDALQAVVAHERAHHDRGHLWVTLGVGLGFIWGVGGVFTAGGISFQVGGVVIGCVAFGLRHVVVRWMRRAELAADAEAGRVTDPRAVITALKRVDEIQPGEAEHAGSSDSDADQGSPVSETSGSISDGASSTGGEAMVDPSVAISPWVDEVISELFLRVHPPLEDRIAALERR